ncbi:hypothetical protein ZWY2020_009090 [Hordeum vulgare]|nr:hypothetical protein ZWY2020_009090 [Hordeum vulgare]
MESGGNGTGRGNLQLVVSELCRIQELVRQLELHLHAPDTSVDPCRALTAQIFALTDRSIGFVAAAHSSDALTTPSSTSSSLSGVLTSLSGPTPRRGDGEVDEPGEVSAAGGAEGPGDDGHSWRKYGQKDILGAKHPRAYYRCTHRNSQGCTATKQVQRADEDPVLFDVVYHGQHTCRPTGRRRRQEAADEPTQPARGEPAAEPQSRPGRGRRSRRPEHQRLCLTSDDVAVDGLACGVWLQRGPTMSPYPAGAYTEWLLDGDLQEVVSVFTAVSALSMDYLFEFDPTFDVDAPNFFM